MSASHQGKELLLFEVFLAPVSAISLVLASGGDAGGEQWTQRYHEALAEESRAPSARQSLHDFQSRIRAVEADIATRWENERRVFTECMPLFHEHSMMPVQPVQPDSVPPSTLTLQPAESGAAGASSTALAPTPAPPGPGVPASDTNANSNPNPNPNVALQLQLGAAADATLSSAHLAAQMRIREAQMYLACLWDEERRVRRARGLCRVYLTSLGARHAGGEAGEGSDDEGDSEDEDEDEDEEGYEMDGEEGGEEGEGEREEDE